MRTLLIDGDMLCYRNAVVLEGGVINWGEGVVSSITPNQQKKAQFRMENQIANWLDQLQADRAIVFLSEPDSTKDFRRKLLPTYKAERKDKVRPQLLMPLKEFLFNDGLYECIRLPHLEADDGLGIWATNPEFAGEKIIITIDKDLRQIPGLYYNPYKDEPKVEVITPAGGDLWWMTQCLIGDTCDGYIGCRGVGPAAVKKFLDVQMPLETLWANVCELFESKGQSRETALQMARVSRILRHGEYNLETGEISLWQPPELLPSTVPSPSPESQPPVVP